MINTRSVTSINKPLTAQLVTIVTTVTTVTIVTAYYLQYISML